MDHVTASSPATRGLDPAKRRAILRGAQEIFLRDGFAAASMDDVARAAGVGKMTVYRHFGSKDALYRDMLEEVCATELFNADIPRGLPLEEELPRLGRAFIDLITDPEKLGTYRLALSEAERTPDVSRLFYEGAVTPVMDIVADRLTAHAPGMGRDEAQILAGVFLQIVQGHAYMRLMLGLEEKPDPRVFDAQIAMAAEMIAARIARRDDAR